MVAAKVVSRETSTSKSTGSSAGSTLSSVKRQDGKTTVEASKATLNNTNVVSHGSSGQAQRMFNVASTFFTGIMAIHAAQLIGAPLRLVDPKFYKEYIAWTKEAFAILCTTITQWWSPTVVRVSGDKSMKGQLFQMKDGTLKCNFPHRLVLMANHQLYTDWMYLWWTAYTNKMHGHISFVLKDDFKNLPIFGWGAQFYNFIFLSRKWDTDQQRFRSALNTMKNPRDPLWLVIFPEGTNLSSSTRERSAAWSGKSGVPDMKHQLLPRSTGLRFCLQELKQTTNWLYDCTIAYEGVPKGGYGQDIFTLKSSFFEGRPPKSVNMFWRRFKISQIPLENEEVFGRWLNNRWREKDYILEYFSKFGKFPDEEPSNALAATTGKRKAKHAKMISTEIRGAGWEEFLGIFGPITSTANALSQIDMTTSFQPEALLESLMKQQQLGILGSKTAPLAAAGQRAVQNALKAAQKSSGLPSSLLSYLINDPPETQEQMRQAVTKSGARTAKRTAPSAAEQKPVKNVAGRMDSRQSVNSKPKPVVPITDPGVGLNVKHRTTVK